MITLVRWRDVAADPAFLDAWHGLESRALESNPFLSPGMLLAAARHLERGERMRLLVDRDAAGDLHFLLPVVGAVPGDVVPASWRLDARGCGVTGLRTWLHPYCFVGTPLLDAAEDPVALWRRVVTGLRRGPGRPWCELPMLSEDGAVARALVEALADVPGVLREELGSRGQVRRRPTATYLDDWLSKKNRANLARRRRQLAAEVGHLACLDRAGDADTALEDFLALEARSWKGENRSAVSARPHHATFFREGLRELAEEKRLVLLSLEGPDGALAQSIVLCGGDEEFGFKRAYDPAWSRYSPGSLLDLEMLERFHGGDAARLDTCSYPGVATHDVFGDRRAMITLVVPTSRAGRRLVPRLWPALRAARSRLDGTRVGARVRDWRHPGGRRATVGVTRGAPVTRGSSAAL